MTWSLPVAVEVQRLDWPWATTWQVKNSGECSSGRAAGWPGVCLWQWRNSCWTGSGQLPDRWKTQVSVLQTEQFDDLVFACGSGGTAAGLALGYYLTGEKLRWVFLRKSSLMTWSLPVAVEEQRLDWLWAITWQVKNSGECSSDRAVWWPGARLWQWRYSGWTSSGQLPDRWKTQASVLQEEQCGWPSLCLWQWRNISWAGHGQLPDRWKTQVSVLQEEQLDDLVFACGSGGTSAGLALGNYLTGEKLRQVFFRKSSWMTWCLPMEVEEHQLGWPWAITWQVKNSGKFSSGRAVWCPGVCQWQWRYVWQLDWL